MCGGGGGFEAEQRPRGSKNPRSSIGGKRLEMMKARGIQLNGGVQYQQRTGSWWREIQVCILRVCTVEEASGHPPAGPRWWCPGPKISRARKEIEILHLTPTTIGVATRRPPPHSTGKPEGPIQSRGLSPLQVRVAVTLYLQSAPSLKLYPRESREDHDVCHASSLAGIQIFTYTTG